MRFLTILTKFHRTMLVLSTVGISVSGSKVAADVTSISWWLILSGFTTLLGVSDMCRQIDEPAKELVRSVQVPYRKAATDVMQGGSRKPLTWAITLSLALLLAGVVVGLLCGFGVET